MRPNLRFFDLALKLSLFSLSVLIHLQPAVADEMDTEFGTVDSRVRVIYLQALHT